MRKLVIVDDEIRQCRGLQNILKRQYADLDIRIFTSAPEALAAIEQEQPDIVITDICMPGMSGLEMTEAVKKIDSRMIVILLTGYAEFEYARKAISVGAFEYLVKPLDLERLKEVLEKAEEELKKTRVLSAQHEKMQQQLDLTLPVYMENILNRWVYGWNTVSEKSEIEKIIPAGKDGFLVVTYLPGLTEKRASLNKKDAEELRSKAIWWMRGMIRHPWHCLSFFSNVLKDLMVTIVILPGGGTERNQEELRASYKQVIRFLEKMARPSFPGEEIDLKEYRMVLGGLQHDLLQNVETSYRDMTGVLPYFFYFPQNDFLCSDYIHRYMTEQIRIGLTEEETLKEAVREGNGEKAKNILREIWDRCCSGGYPEPAQLKNCFANVLERIAFSMCLKTELSSCKEAGSYEQFLERAETYLDELTMERRKGKTGKNADLLRQMEQYLEEHFCEDITLDELAEHFGFAASYCSKLIKNATDDNFSRLIVEKRMKKAKELLGETELKIYEIAEQTGYGDVKYFNRVFKKETGVTPIQYRRAFGKAGGENRNE